MKASLFLFRLPREWAPFFMLHEQVPGWTHGRPDLDWVHIGMTTIPMGWINAVGILQYLHRQLVARCSSLPKHLELRRDAPLPVDKDFVTRSFVEMFVDNLDGFAFGQVLEKEKMQEYVLLLRGSGEKVGIIYDDGEKRVSGAPATKTLGAEVSNRARGARPLGKKRADFLGSHG